MKKPSRHTLSNRRYGNLVEALFEVEMLEHGIVTARPRGEPDDFDFFAVIGTARPVRVQVKGTRGCRAGSKLNSRPSVRVASRHRPSSTHSYAFDFLVVWVDAPFCKWLVIPRRALPRGTVCLNFRASESFARSRWGRFVDRWDLFRGV